MSVRLCRVSATLVGHERRREHGNRWLVLDRDPLRSMAYWRRARRSSAHAAAQYAGHRELVRRPVLGQLRMIEAAIRCDLAAREALNAWRMIA